MKETKTNYKLKENRIVNTMKYLYALTPMLSVLFIVTRNTWMTEYPILPKLFIYYMSAFLIIQIPYFFYYRYAYKKDSVHRKNQFENTNNI